MIKKKDKKKDSYWWWEIYWYWYTIIDIRFWADIKSRDHFNRVGDEKEPVKVINRKYDIKLLPCRRRGTVYIKSGWIQQHFYVY